jgi:hypothetical protein
MLILPSEARGISSSPVIVAVANGAQQHYTRTLTVSNRVKKLKNCFKIKVHFLYI